ncbi:MAG: hypothetical protein PHP26_10875 [Syntrophomonas sp.]|nr:hypothetical protein [Syntrophomonas sp.]MDD2510579.1 hypothetical protein [Syntrophomonas sp.]MDD3880469.1 hypothetical protein [Syntrophomonas sp.]MDD4626300.1 hypothetical protein [Syntrophomonas sp.]
MQAVDENEIHLIIMDVMMPKMASESSNQIHLLTFINSGRCTNKLP